MKTACITALALALSLGCKSDKKETPKEAPKTVATNESPAEPEAKPPTAKDNADAVARYAKAYLSADAAALRELLHKDVIFQSADGLIFGTDPQKGVEKDIESAKQFKMGWDQALQPDQLVIATPTKVAIILQIKMKAKAENPVEDVRGKTGSMFAAQVFSFDEQGKITRADMLLDDATIAHQMGVRPDKGGSPDSVEMWADPIVALSSGSDVEKANLETIKKASEAISKMDTDALAALVSEPFLLHDTADPEPSIFKTRGDFKKMHAAQKEMLEVVSRRIDDRFAAGDWVFQRVQQVVRFKKEVPEIKDSKGKTVERTQFNFLRLQDGLVAEVRTFHNDLQLFAQLGTVDVKAIQAKLLPPKKDDAN